MEIDEGKLTEALAAITSRQEQLANDRASELRGPAGPRGEKGESIVGPEGKPGRDGRDGKDGADAPAPRIVIGNVSAGERAAATLRRNSEGVHILDLVLPRGFPGAVGERGASGSDGKDSTVPGPCGPAGSDGKDSVVPGPQGIPGESIKGEKGDPGMTREEIVQALIETLQDAGVMTEQAQKLLAVRAELKAAIKEADRRNQAQYQRFLEDTDKKLF